MSWIALSLGSAASLSLTDLFAKRALGKLPVSLVAWARVALPVPLLGLAVVLWGWQKPGGVFWWAVLAGLPLELLATLLYQRALQLSPLGLTAPYLAFTPAFLVLTGWAILGEAPSLLAGLGIGLVTFGGFAIQAPSGGGIWGPLRALARERGSLLMLAVAFLYSLTAAIGKVGAQAANPQTFAFVYFTLLSVVLAPWAARGWCGTSQSSAWRPLLGVALCSAAMILCHLAAIVLAPASYMVAVKRTSLLWSILLGHFVLGEPAVGRRLGAGAVILAGVGCIAMA